MAFSSIEEQATQHSLRYIMIALYKSIVIVALGLGQGKCLPRRYYRLETRPRIQFRLKWDFQLELCMAILSFNHPYFQPLKRSYRQDLERCCS